ncbi:hypothetical protein [Cryobacterium sp. PH31-L1]|uniref:PKD domain-containing protein n=1 Tax=Cryobacterium sp. PH31-L1 TaxID=3046199 RepID=UPI0024BB57CC|nr:hypothetical protein [Cryobacterium sp. PH31-L1]MDJ0378405.1 hypothetical protein [Cryobacterium sp. PH31-L1]
MEPGGWAIVGLAANFWATASAHIGDGLLLGQPAQVLFTPINYRWNFGDGSTASSPTGGASWADLGLAEFSTTPTSHKYAAKDSYTVTLTVDYRADYSLGDQGWPRRRNRQHHSPSSPPKNPPCSSPKTATPTPTAPAADAATHFAAPVKDEGTPT